MDSNWQLPPRPYQWNEYVATMGRANHCLFWDQGTGKTAVVLATAAHLSSTGKIDAMIVLAPRGVEANWAIDEISKHLAVDHRVALWNTGKRNTKKHREMIDELLAFDGFKVLCMSYPGIMTDDGAKLVKKMLTSYRCLYVADEATVIKTPDAKVTKRVLASSKYATYRRLLNGTPVEDSPFQAYSQVKFSDPNIWEQRGIRTYGQFKAYYGIFEKRTRKDGRSFPDLISYRNLDDLGAAMREAGTRVMKEDVLPDLPAKSYQKLYFEMSPEQWRVYRGLRDELFAELQAGLEVSAELAIVKLVRFAQITSGYVPADDEEGLVRFGKNPRLDALKTVLDTHGGKKIVWAKYTQEIDDIAKLLTERGVSHCIYDGRTSSEDRQRYKEEFQNGEYEVFLAKPSAAGRGLTLTAANTVIYFSNSFSLDERKQSEDRAHRIGQHHPVLYIDLVARGTVDEHIITILCEKRDRSAIVTGDTLKAWL